MPEDIVDVQGLSRTFGTAVALDGVTFQLKPGLVYGLVGSNGAGKSTLIRHLLGLMTPQQGTVRVMGLDPVKSPVEVLSQIGYLSEERDLPEWMRIDELLSYTSAFYPGWDFQYANDLLRTFGLDPSKKVKHLSKGMRAQAGLIVAVAHRPRLLLLDEPSTGLDAVIRNDILNAIIRTVADDGRTALFSSHLLDEVEQMSDELLMVDGGRIVLRGTVDSIRQRHVVASLECSAESGKAPDFSGLISAERVGQQWRVVCEVTTDDSSDLPHRLAERGIRVSDVRDASLQEIFVARAGRERRQKREVSQ
jgi:ABC-2 type transport system ATP-binding protein